jgi:transcriptional regulator with XRE-family HTH domain
MKLELDKAWYSERIARENDLEATTGAPDLRHPTQQNAQHDRRQPEEVFAEQHAFGSLIQMLRRDRKLTVEQLAADARISLAEIISIEEDSKHVPRARTVRQLTVFFGLPAHTLEKLSNVAEVDDLQLKDAAIRFAASSRTIMELTGEERQALSEFVNVLASRDARQT